MGRLKQERYKTEVLFSILNDSGNLLIRDQLRPRGFVVDEADGWKDRVIAEYVPMMARALPLASGTIEPAQETGAEFRLVMERELVRLGVTAFLDWFMRKGVEANVITSEALDETDTRSVADQVVSAWQWIEF